MVAAWEAEKDAAWFRAPWDREAMSRCLGGSIVRAMRKLLLDARGAREGR